MITEKTKITDIIHCDVSWWTDEPAPTNVGHPKNFASTLKKAIESCKQTANYRWRAMYFWTT